MIENRILRLTPIIHIPTTTNSKQTIAIESICNIITTLATFNNVSIFVFNIYAICIKNNYFFCFFYRSFFNLVKFWLCNFFCCFLCTIFLCFYSCFLYSFFCNFFFIFLLYFLCCFLYFLNYIRNYSIISIYTTETTYSHYCR